MLTDTKLRGEDKLTTIIDEKIFPKKDRVWKNRYLVKLPWNAKCQICDKAESLKEGDEFISCCRTWPSKEEAKAYNDRNANLKSVRNIYVAYIAYLGPIAVEPA